jgi:RNA methyltransferase, RsmD family
MRIITGKFKNKKLFFSESLTTRPLKDRVRESIFNILEHSNILNTQIKNASILDLYAGVGSFGLECISRGAKRISFVENNYHALVNLKKNIDVLEVEKQTELYSVDILKFLDKSQITEKFDVVFSDPPYHDQEFCKIFEIIKKIDVLRKNIKSSYLNK